MVTILYRYVLQDPVNHFDPPGLTEQDVRIALALIADVHRDLGVPGSVSFADLRGDAQGETSIWRGDITLDVQWLQPLSDGMAENLLETLIHETLHANDNPIERWWDGNVDTDHSDIYREAFDRTTRRLIDDFNRLRSASCR